MSYRQFVLGSVAALALFLPSVSHAQNTQAPKWQGHVEAEGKWGNKRSIGEGGLFIPVWQNEDTLLFTDLRTRFDNNSSNEGNFGLGLRKQINNDWIIGGYGFYDSRKTPSGNHFDQATLGAEAMSENMEFRINGYLPEATKKAAGSVSYTASVSGSNLQISTYSAPKERALPGVDVEVGRKFDIPGDWTFWAYAGGYHFDAPNYDNVTGPRGRIEVSYDDVPYFGTGSRFTLGVEAQYDSVRDTQEFAIARLRIPFSSFSNNKKSTPKLDALDKRMTSRIYRDVDIVSGEQAAQLESTETATATLASGTKVSSFTTIDATDNISADITAAGANKLIILDGSAGTINTATRVLPPAGQTIVGGGTTITVTGSTNGQSAPLTLPGTAATVNGTADTMVFLATNDDTVLQNFTISGSGTGININTSDGVQLKDLTIQNTTNDSIAVVGGDNVTISGVNMISPNGGGEEGIQFYNSNSTSVSITNSTVEDANIGFIFVNGGFVYSNVSFSNVSVNNVVNALEVQGGVPSATLNNPSGAITATNVSGTDCLNNGTINGSTLTINGVTCN